MPSAEQPYDIEPYLNPRYWGGHTLGMGKTRPDPLERNPPLQNDEFARAALQYGLRSGPVTPLRTFHDGDTFNPALYYPGALVLFREEVLYGEPVRTDYDEDGLSRLTAQPIPARPTGVQPCFGKDVPVVVAMDGKRYYGSRVQWGVVLPHGASNHFSAISARSVARGNGGARVVAGSAFASRAAPVVVGETVHRPKTERVVEWLRRVNILHLITYGVPRVPRSRSTP